MRRTGYRKRVSQNDGSATQRARREQISRHRKFTSLIVADHALVEGITENHHRFPRGRAERCDLAVEY